MSRFEITGMVMATLCIILLLVGVALLLTEIFMPGFGVCGICGLIALVVSAVLAVLYVPYGGLLVAAAVVMLAAMGYVMFKYIKKRQLYGKLILDETLNEDLANIGDLGGMVGKEGVAKTPLKPFGEVDFNGMTLEVSSDGAFVSAGARVRAVGVRNRTVIVAAARQQ